MLCYNITFCARGGNLLLDLCLSANQILHTYANLNKKKRLTNALVCVIVLVHDALEEHTMQYAIINFATQQTTFFETFAQASAACTAYNSSNMSSVYVIDLQENAIEKL